MMTNFDTIQQRIRRMRELREMSTNGTFEHLPKKEVSKLREILEKLERVLAGMEHLRTVPEALFVVDVKKENIAILEARRLDIPVVAIVDTNCDPDMADFVVPANDDAIRAIRLIASKMADAVIEGRHEYEAKMVELHGEAGYLPEYSPFRPLPEQVITEVATLPEGTAEEDLEEAAVEEAVVEFEDALEFVDEDEPIITEKEKYFEVAKDYGAIGEED